MNIQIGENWLVTSDPMNVTLNQRYEKQKGGKPCGEYDWKPVAHCKDLAHACDKLLEKELNIADAENLSEIVCIIQRAKTDILSAMAEEKESQVKVGKIRKLANKCDEDGRPVETWEIFDILDPEEAAK